MSLAVDDHTFKSGRRARHHRHRQRLAIAVVLSVALNAAAVVTQLYVENNAKARAPASLSDTAISARIIPVPSGDAEQQMADPTADRSATSTLEAQSVVSSPVTPTSVLPTSSSPETHEVEAVSAVPSASSPSTYFRSGDLEQSPVPLADIAPDYPEAAESKRGHVVLEIFVNESGSVDRVDVLSANPPGLFEESARSAFLQAKFEPGRRLGIPTKTRMTIEVEYRPADRNGQLSSKGY